MTIIRAVKDRTNPYVQINKKVFEDEKLSLKAKGFIGFCLCKPDHWVFHVAHLATVLVEKETAIYSTINECIEKGYAVRFIRKNSQGAFTKWETIISDSKEEILRIKQEIILDPNLRLREPKEKLKKCLPLRENPEVDESDVETRTLVKNDISKKESRDKSSSRASSSHEPPPDNPPSQEAEPPGDVPNFDDASGGDDACGAGDSSFSSQNKTQAREEDISVTKTNGSKLTMTHSAIFRHFLKFPYPTEVVKEAIIRLRENPGPVNNILKYLEVVCEGIIKNKKEPKQTFTETKSPPTDIKETEIPENSVTLGELIRREYDRKRKAKKDAT